jgi:predicted DNA-binding transcriptional regulator AlpA
MLSDLQLLSKRQVISMLSISKTTLDVWRREHGFPQPIRIHGLNRWRPAEIETWVRANAGLREPAVLPRSEPSGTGHADTG